MFSRREHLGQKTTGFLPLVQKVPLVAFLVISASFLVALVLWTLPTWRMLAPSLTQFPLLWETDKRTFIVLIVKLCSPLLLVLLLGTGFRLWWLIKPFLLKQAAPSVESDTILSSSITREGNTEKKLPLSSLTSFPAPLQAGSAVSHKAHLQVLESRIATHSSPLCEDPPPSLWNMQEVLKELWQHPETLRRGLSAHAETLRKRRRRRLYKDGVSPRLRARAVKIPSSTDLPLPEVVVSATQKSEEALTTQITNIVQQGAAPPMEVESEIPYKEEGESQEQGPCAYEITLTLLKRLSLTIHAQGRSREVPLTLNAKRVQLLAYIAWQRGQSVHRDRLVEHVFGHGKDDEEATREKLGAAFGSHKKLIRSDLRETILKMNTEAGYELIPPDLDIFSHRYQHYTLAPTCRVVDLDEIEAQHGIIEDARKQGSLVDQVPEAVKEACDRLIAAYSGDFLEELIKNHLDDFDPWTSSWARKPYTLYRDYYLQAVWYLAEYELHRGQIAREEPGEGEIRHKELRKHWELAAQHYRMYAMEACDTRFDTKVSFGGRGPGERVIMSERALRRSLVLYGAIGATYLVDQVYAAYCKQMRSISAKVWEPSKETLSDLRSAKEQTNAYRFPNQITPPEPMSQQGGSGG